MSDLIAVLDYHQRTKHAPWAFARSLGYLDWDNQPNPFRSFEGVDQVALDLMDIVEDVSYELSAREGALPTRPLDRASISQLFRDSLALSAWKEAGTARWALRVNPSSGNLHPTEAYLVCGAIPGLTEAPAVWHYNPLHHGLERRAEYPGWARLRADLPAGAVLVGLTSIVWREAWKYGERAFRYCQHDVGHAIAAVAIAAAGLGWKVRLLEGVPDDTLALVLGTATQTGPEREIPECLLVLYPAGEELPTEQLRFVRPPPAGPALGRPRPLGTEHHDWPILETVEAATRKTTAPPASWWADAAPPIAVEDSAPRLRALVHQRRSAVAMDGRTGLEREAFLQMLRKCGPGAVPLRTLPWAPRVNLLLFVHRIRDLDPGLYLLERAPGLPHAGEEVEPGLFRLRAGDVRGLAQGVSCDQAIAHQGAFAVAMIAEFRRSLQTDGPWMYRRLHWEAGAIGQVLYLEAEASGVRGTGIGCFYDDLVHEALAIGDDAWRCLYNFTIGGPVEDERLQTVAPYVHLQRAR